MKRLLPALGVLVLVVGVVAVVRWQRPDAAPPPEPLKDVVLKYSDGTTMWDSGKGEKPGPLVNRVLFALETEATLPLAQARRTGATVHTTIDPVAQGAANTVLLSKAPVGRLEYSITAIDHATGAVRVYVPNRDGRQDGADYAGGVVKQVGATIMPFDAVAAMQAGKPLSKEFDGRSPRRIGGSKVEDDPANRCGERCTIRQALVKASRVVMYDLMLNELGPKKVADAMHQAGVPREVTVDGQPKKLLVGDDGKPDSGIAIGANSAAMRPLDLTTAYATLAAEGTFTRPYFIAKVDAGNGILYQAAPKSEPAFAPDAARSKEIATEVGSALKEGTRCPGVVCRTGELGRYTGSEDTRNIHAFVAGYTPKLAVTVFVGSTDPAMPIEEETGAPPGGAGLPLQLWQSFVAQAS